MRSIFLTPAFEPYELKLLKRDEGNNAFTYGEKETTDSITQKPRDLHNSYISFRGRVGSNIDKKQVRITKGVMGSEDNTLIVSSNLPNVCEVGDKVIFLDKVWTVQSIGILLNETKILNGAIFSEEYLLNRCAKTITLG